MTKNETLAELYALRFSLTSLASRKGVPQQIITAAMKEAEEIKKSAPKEILYPEDPEIAKLHREKSLQQEKIYWLDNDIFKINQEINRIEALPEKVNTLFPFILSSLNLPFLTVYLIIKNIGVSLWVLASLVAAPFDKRKSLTRALKYYSRPPFGYYKLYRIIKKEAEDSKNKSLSLDNLNQQKLQKEQELNNIYNEMKQHPIKIPKDEAMKKNQAERKAKKEQALRVYLQRLNEAQAYTIETLKIEEQIKTRFSKVLSIQNWPLLDLIIDIINSDRADNVKEAMHFIDEERRNNNLINAIYSAKKNIVKEIKNLSAEVRNNSLLIAKNINNNISNSNNYSNNYQFVSSQELVKDTQEVVNYSKYLLEREMIELRNNGGYKK